MKIDRNNMNSNMNIQKMKKKEREFRKLKMKVSKVTNEIYHFLFFVIIETISLFIQSKQILK